VYPLSGNNASLTTKEAASNAAKMAVSFFAVKLTALPLPFAGKYLLSWDKKVFQNEGHSFFVQTGAKLNNLAFMITDPFSRRLFAWTSASFLMQFGFDQQYFTLCIRLCVCGIFCIL
jgi:hypothetical protein